MCIHTYGRKRGEILNVCYFFRELGIGKMHTRHKKIRGKSKQEARARFPFLLQVTYDCSIHPSAFVSPTVHRTYLVWQTWISPGKSAGQGKSRSAPKCCCLESSNGLVRKELPWAEYPVCWTGQVPSCWTAGENAFLWYALSFLCAVWCVWQGSWECSASTDCVCIIRDVFAAAGFFNCF